jgi:hypothetical protein
MVGVRTGKIAVSFAVFNILMLISRTAVTFQVPLLTKFVEHHTGGNNLINIFNLIIIVSGIATVIAAFLIPTFQRIFFRGVLHFSVDRSIPRLVIHSFSKAGVNYIKDCVAIPVKENITELNFRKLPIKIIIYNLITVALLTVGALAPIYAGSIAPDLRATCITLSSIINGIATILMSIFIDPHLSIMTDDVTEGKCTEKDFRTVVVAMVGSKTLGTFASLLLIIPSSYLIVFVAKII